MIDLLLTHATVITMDPVRAILEDGAVAIDQGRIVEVGPTAEVASRHQAEALALVERAGLQPHMGHQNWGQVYQTFSSEFIFPE